MSATCVFNEGKWLATASNDKTICLYIFGCQSPFATLKDHTNTVCALAQGLTPTTLISGSWDQTARIWNNLDVDASSVELKGHDAAVWAVAALKSGKYATGSADKTIFVWNSKGEKLVVLKGHTDCIRGLASLDDGSLLSCSNDATIRHWSDTYDCIREFHGHSNYIYAIALNPALGDVFVTGSEDNTIRLWSLSKGALGDSLALPVQSVWSVACTPAGDIVSGSSDGVIRVFSKDPGRIAPPDSLAAYDVAVLTRKTEQSKELGGVKVNDIPGPESLLQEGVEGQTRLVRQPNGKILCYQWTKGNWECVGDVMGASGGSTETSGKSLHEGKEYDFVFNVDIEDGKPPLKLPFNKSEDPWLAAQKFIHKNDLPQVYLEQVANFIITNAKITIPTMSGGSDFADPFTGGGRYIPSGGDAASGAAPAVDVNFRERSGNSGIVNVDPFTSGSSYSSGKQDFIVKKHLPMTQPIYFEVYDSAKILTKVKEFNGQVDASLKMSDEALAAVIGLIDVPTTDKVTLESLEFLTSWPQDKLFPVLDVVRLIVRNKGICESLPKKVTDAIIFNLVSSPPNQLMSARALSNILQHGYGKDFVAEKLNEITEQLSKVSQGNVHLQTAIATFYLNQSALQKASPSDEMCLTLTIGIIKLLEWVADPEATFRTYQALGNLILFNSATVLSIVKTVDPLKEALQRNKTALYEKLAEISAELAEKVL